MHEHSIASHWKLWLMHAKVFKIESQTNNEHTVAVLCQKQFYSLAPLIWFFCFLIRNLIHFFFLLFIAATGLKIHTMLIPGTTLINGSSPPPNPLVRGTTSIREGRVIPWRHSFRWILYYAYSKHRLWKIQCDLQLSRLVKRERKIFFVKSNLFI